MPRLGKEPLTNCGPVPELGSAIACSPSCSLHTSRQTDQQGLTGQDHGQKYSRTKRKTYEARMTDVTTVTRCDVLHQVKTMHGSNAHRDINIVFLLIYRTSIYLVVYLVYPTTDSLPFIFHIQNAGINLIPIKATCSPSPIHATDLEISPSIPVQCKTPKLYAQMPASRKLDVGILFLNV